MLPDREEFPYAIRQLSEAMGSNGSTSMGSVCASTLSLLQAGVPLKASVAGIAMGLISGEVDGETQYVALTDILGAEDAFGDMDFKVAGTREFVTALQLDTKLDGIPAEVLAAALTQAKDARMTILDVMAEAIDEPEEMSIHAPRIITIKIPVDKIGEVIGPKGKIINQIQDDTGASISIEDDGTIYIGATNGEAAQAAKDAINQIANPTMPEIGERYLGTVVKTTNFGAFVSLMPGKDGLLHISKLRDLAGGKRVDAVEDVVSVGQKIQVQIAEIDDRGKLSLVPVVEDADGRRRRRRRGRLRVTNCFIVDPPEGNFGRVDAFSDHAHARHRARRRRTGDLAGPPYRRCPAGCGSSPSSRPASARPAIGVWVGVGSRDESPTLHGCSHFLEHLLFKGTAGALGARHLGRARRGRRRVQRLHRQGVHLLPRAGPRRGPAAGRRRARRHDHQLDAHARGRRGRARRDPRRDRDARRRPRRRRPQPLRRAGLGRLAAGPRRSPAPRPRSRR